MMGLLMGRVTEGALFSSGSVVTSGAKPNWSVVVDLMDDGGNSLSGQYIGDYYQLPVFGFR